MASSPIVRHGRRGAATGRVAKSMGSHLVQGDDRSMPRLQAGQGLVEQLAVGEGAGGIRCRQRRSRARRRRSGRP